MKKLLSTLALISICTTPMISVVSCSTNINDSREDINDVIKNTSSLSTIDYEDEALVKKQFEKQFNFKDWDNVNTSLSGNVFNISTEGSSKYKGEYSTEIKTKNGKLIPNDSTVETLETLLGDDTTMYLVIKNNEIDSLSTIWQTLNKGTVGEVDWDFKDSIKITGLEDAYKEWKSKNVSFDQTKNGSQDNSSAKDVFKNVSIKILKNIKIKQDNKWIYIKASDAETNLPSVSKIVSGTLSESYSDINNEMDYLLNNNYMGQVDLKIEKDNKQIYRYQTGLSDQTKEDSQINDNSLYRVMSMTKPLTSVAFLHLIDLVKKNNIKIKSDYDSSKSIDFNSQSFSQIDMKDFFKEWDKDNLKLQNSNEKVASDITLEEMMTMTSGIDYFTSDMITVLAQWKSNQWTMDQFAQGMASTAIAFQPGTSWKYGLNMDLIGAVGNKILENNKISGISETNWEDYIKNEFLTKLDMNNSYYGKALSEDALKNLVIPGRTDVVNQKFINDDKNILLDFGWQNSLDKDQPCPLGGNTLITTTDDYIKLQHLLMTGLDKDGKTLVDKSTIDNMHTNHLSDNIISIVKNQSLLPEGFGYGYGVDVKIDQPTFSNSVSTTSFGWDGMFSSLSIMDPKDNVNVVLMTNVTDENPTIITEIYNIIFDSLRKNSIVS